MTTNVLEQAKRLRSRLRAGTMRPEDYHNLDALILALFGADECAIYLRYGDDIQSVCMGARSDFVRAAAVLLDARLGSLESLEQARKILDQ